MTTAPWAALAETHTSVLFFVGDRVLKLKKPQDLGFLDFRTRAARERACRREVALNRRLAPDVYLGVADVTGPDGEPCEHLVVMRRMPADRRLSTLVRQGAPLRPEVRRLARLLAAFHARCATSPAIAAAGRADVQAGLWVESLDAMAPYAGTVLDPEQLARVRTLATRWLAGRAALLDERVAAGRIRDGHGDLQADDIYLLDDGPRVLDCLEFDERLRVGDVLLDVAFLAMDLERLGAPQLADALCDDWAEFAGETHPRALRELYVGYRALVRAKVACIRHGQGDPDAADQARTLLDLCRGHLERARVRLVLVGGLPGTGKTTVAAAVAERTGWLHLSSDMVRKELAGLAPGASAAAGWQEGIYSPTRTQATYDALLLRAVAALRHGESVILDASWSGDVHRAAARDAAARALADLVEVQLVAPDDLADRRMAARVGPSDADSDTRRRMARTQPPWPSARRVSTDQPLQRSVAAVLAAADVQDA